MSSAPSASAFLPADVQLSVARDYGATASEKSNELLLHMALAVVSVALLICGQATRKSGIWLALGKRESGIVMLAIPATLALTLTVFYFYGYTLNRITLFALIFSIGILVDDAIVIRCASEWRRHQASWTLTGTSRTTSPSTDC